MLSAQHYHFAGAAVSLPFSRKDVYKIWLLGRGGHLCLPTGRVALTAPALFFAHPLVPYAYDNPDLERSGYWCVFTHDQLPHAEQIGSQADTSPFALDAQAVLLLTEPQVARVQVLFEQLLAELASTYPHRYAAARHYVGLLLHEGRKHQPLAAAPPASAASRLVGLFRAAVEQQFPIETPQQPLRRKKAGDFAAQLAVHVNHLNAVVKAATGKSTSDYLAERVFHEAQALLTYTTWSVADIAYSLDFAYPNHFTAFFKKHAGTTPLAFRQRVASLLF